MRPDGLTTSADGRAAAFCPGRGVDQVEAVLRESLREARTRAAHGLGGGVNWAFVRGDLDLAAACAEVGTEVPDLTRFRGPTRKLARGMARVVLYLARVVTGRQSQFNYATVATLRHLAAGMAALEEELRATRLRLEEAERKLAETAASREISRDRRSGEAA